MIDFIIAFDVWGFFAIPSLLYVIYRDFTNKKWNSIEVICAINSGFFIIVAFSILLLTIGWA